MPNLLQEDASNQQPEDLVAHTERDVQRFYMNILEH